MHRRKGNSRREGFHLKPPCLSHKKLPAHGLLNLQRAGNVFPYALDAETQTFLSNNLNSASQDHQKTPKRYANGSFNEEYHVHL